MCDIEVILYPYCYTPPDEEKRLAGCNQPVFIGLSDYNELSDYIALLNSIRLIDMRHIFFFIIDITE